jgi:hypothetical protein
VQLLVSALDVDFGYLESVFTQVNFIFDISGANTLSAYVRRSRSAAHCACSRISH